MKKILLILSLFVSLVGFSQLDTEFNISGDIYFADSCGYFLYDIDDRGNWRFVKYVELESSYAISVKPYRTYLIIFEAKNAFKHMYLHLKNAASYEMSLNFRAHTHPTIYYDESKHRYSSYSVDDSVIDDLYKH